MKFSDKTTALQFSDDVIHLIRQRIALGQHHGVALAGFDALHDLEVRLVSDEVFQTRNIRDVTVHSAGLHVQHRRHQTLEAPDLTNSIASGIFCSPHIARGAGVHRHHSTLQVCQAADITVTVNGYGLGTVIVRLHKGYRFQAPLCDCDRRQGNIDSA